MFVHFMTIISMVQFAIAGKFPNGTDTNINFFSCNPANIINVMHIELFDRNGLSMYPIKLEELATARIKAYNNGNVVAREKVNVEVYAFVEKDGLWMWRNIVPEPFRFLL
ncbi:unnamed protein product [Litomosoides sigmodontis]|uniref:Uncharacterized protein n=1 Tax=Litomosoides sigmodontis TaxID=42156 RepID=A0A3P6VEQ6_LITSI|nr:unnamed protein product [Litomosoides sigmodontis]